MSEFRNTTIGFDQVLAGTATEIEEKLRETEQTAGKVGLLEEFLLGLLDQGPFPDRENHLLLNRFHSENTGIREFCRSHGVHPRTLERKFNKYVGATPKAFLRLMRFQTALNSILNSPADALTPLAHDLDFYDQPHFIKDFKAFTGSSPSRFLKEKQSVMQITKNVYPD